MSEKASGEKGDGVLDPSRSLRLGLRVVVRSTSFNNSFK